MQKGIAINMLGAATLEVLVNGGLINATYLVVCLSNFWQGFEFGLVHFGSHLFIFSFHIREMRTIQIYLTTLGVLEAADCFGDTIFS